MRVALLAKVPRDSSRLDADSQLRRMRRYAESRDWLVTREYVDEEGGELPGRGARKMIIDASVNWFDAVLIADLDGYGGSLHVVIRQLAKHRVSLVCTHKEDQDSFLGAKVVLGWKKEVVERDVSMLDVPWDLRTPSWSRARQCSLREWR